MNPTAGIQSEYVFGNPYRRTKRRPLTGSGAEIQLRGRGSRRLLPELQRPNAQAVRPGRIALLGRLRRAPDGLRDTRGFPGVCAVRAGAGQL